MGIKLDHLYKYRHPRSILLQYSNECDTVETQNKQDTQTLQICH